MPRKHDETTVSRHIEVYEADWHTLMQLFGPTSDTRLGVSTAIRQMIRKGIRDYEERVQRKLDRTPRSAATLPALDDIFNGSE